ncbi:MAG: aminodeoxychorismate/anthranilate synthase component II [Desulfobacterales bacterium]|nr:aminodeoxychorismate/anthranilate synthase component II [Desulfobacterales bacterium]
MIVMIDNFDSFTYNLVQYLSQLGADMKVIRNNAATVAEIESWNPNGIVISPGPGKPDSAGISLDAVKQFSGKCPLLGVCLGHQTIAEVFGGKIISSKKIMHGKTSSITTDGKGLFNGIKSPFDAMRYHSLAVSRDSISDDLIVTAESDDNEIMGIRHKTHPTEGIQFHPESIMTPVGKRLLRNYLKSTNEID